MSTKKITIPTRYPDKGMTIFSFMTGLAQKHNAINLSQGFPDFSMEQGIMDKLSEATNLGYNQYAPMSGLPILQEAISQKYAFFQDLTPIPHDEITVTPGATYAIYTALSTILEPYDEVIVLEPAYDSYIPNIIMLGGVPKTVSLNPENFRVDWEALRLAVSDKTKAIIVNNPHNPCGIVWTHDEMLNLEQFCVDNELFLIADEVYEHIVFDGGKHLSALRYPGLRERSFVIGSFGKICHSTGWKVGYCIAPNRLTTAFRKIHQYLAFSVNAPAQYAIGSYFLEDMSRMALYSGILEQKRNLFIDLLSSTRFKIKSPAQGSYFQVVDYSDIDKNNDLDFAKWLVKAIGVAAIPMSSFNNDNSQDGHLLRFCFAKLDDTLISAVNRLASI